MVNFNGLLLKLIAINIIENSLVHFYYYNNNNYLHRITLELGKVILRPGVDAQ